MFGGEASLSFDGVDALESFIFEEFVYVDDTEEFEEVSDVIKRACHCYFLRLKMSSIVPCSR